MSGVGRSVFQPKSTFGMFEDEALNDFLSDMQSQVAFEFDNSYRVLGNARNIDIAIPGYNDNLQEAIETSIQEALFPILTEGQNSLIPKKSIVAYAGTYSEARRLRGWGVCDGTIENGFQKPDLRHKFIRGAGNQEDAGETGGCDCSDVEVANHDQLSDSFNSDQSLLTVAVLACSSGTDVSPDNHIHGVTVTFDISAHDVTQSDNKPPFYEAIWLIKL